MTLRTSVTLHDAQVLKVSIMRTLYCMQSYAAKTLLNMPALTCATSLTTIPSDMSLEVLVTWDTFFLHLCVMTWRPLLQLTDDLQVCLMWH